MDLNRPTINKIDIAQVCRDARQCMRENGNYGRTAATLALFMSLVNVPLILMQLIFYNFGDFSAFNEDLLQLISTRLVLFQMLLMVFVSPAFELSKNRFMLGAVETGKAGSPSALFDGLNGHTYFLSVRAMVWKLFLLYAWVMMPISLTANGYILYLSGGSATMAIVGGVILIIVIISRMIAYSLQFYILAQRPEAGAILSQRMSTAVMHGRYWEYIRLNIRLLPYTILPLASNALPFFVMRDSIWFASAMAGITILLWAVCRPVAEAAMAEYFVALRRATQVQSKEPVSADFTVGEIEEEKSPFEGSIPEGEDTTNK